jgi:RimJ/RimL family protein N-acetyltransferase
MDPEILETARLLLRRPTPADAAVIFDRYAGDPLVTRYLSWPCRSPKELNVCKQVLQHV